MKRGWLLGLLALLLGFSVPISTEAQTRKKPKKAVGQLRKDLGKVRQKKAAVRKELRKTRAEAREVKVDIQVVDTRLNVLEDKLEKTTQRLSAGQSRQIALARDLKAATAKLASSKAAVQRRLKTMYMRGDSMVLTAFVRSGDVGEIAARKFLLEQIAKEDRRVFEDYIDARNEVSLKKAQQDRVVAQVRSLKSEQLSSQNELEGVRKEKGQYLGQLRAKEQDLAEILRQFERDENAIAGQIQAYLAAQRRPGGVSLPPFRGGFGRPVPGPITSTFGMRFHPILRRTKLHTGIDFRANFGTPIRAAASGVVIGATYLRGYGNTVILDHGSGRSTVYAHCSRVYVRAGAKIARGQTIGAVGSTGYSTGPHLHFEIRINGRPVNPSGQL